MSLMQLLKVGRSFAGTKDGPSGYKYQKNALPKFAAKHPASSPTVHDEEPRPAETPLLFDEDAMKGRRKTRKARSAKDPAANETLVMSVLLETPTERPASAPAETARSVALADAVTLPAAPRAEPAMEASPFVARDASAPAVSRPRRSFFDWLLRRHPRHGRLVQAEWSLERIRVVRNDLSDSDLELIPRPLIIPKRVSGRSGLAGRAWKFLTFRLRRGRGK